MEFEDIFLKTNISYIIYHICNDGLTIFCFINFLCHIYYSLKIINV